MTAAPAGGAGRRAIPEIVTEGLLLRAMRREDAPLLLEFFRDPEAGRYWFTPDKTIDEAYARVERLDTDWLKNGFGDWAVVERSSGRFIGFAGLHFISGMPEVNLGYLLASSVWGRGYGTQACRAVVRFGFETAQLEKIVGVTHPDNHASIRVLEKLGMKFWKDMTRDGGPRLVYRLESAWNI